MAWQSGKPEATDKLRLSQDDLKGNFTELDTYLNVDHEDFNAVNGQGKHKQLTMPQQAAATSTGATEFALYTKTNGTNPALFLRKPSDGAEVDLTTQPTVSTTLPNGLIMKWGTGSIALGSYLSGAITFGTAFPNGVFICQISANAGNTGAAQDYVFFINTFNQTTLNVQRNNSYVGTVGYFNYLALGY